MDTSPHISWPTLDAFHRIMNARCKFIDATCAEHADVCVLNHSSQYKGLYVVVADDVWAKAAVEGNA